MMLGLFMQNVFHANHLHPFVRSTLEFWQIDAGLFSKLFAVFAGLSPLGLVESTVIKLLLHPSGPFHQPVTFPFKQTNISLET